MKKFKVGDWVTVRKSLKVGDPFGVYAFIKKMKKLKGKTFTISNFDGCVYHLANVPGLGFMPEMLKPVLKPEIKTAFKALKKLARRIKPAGPSEYYYYVLRARLNENRIFITVSKTPTLLSFKTLKKAEKFRKKYADLLEMAKPLL